MLSDLLLLLLIVNVTMGEPTAPGIDRTVSPGVTSLGYKVIYGDEDLTIFNDVVDEVEKKALKSKIRLNSGMRELPAEDVKCLMSADHYCTKAMKETKEVIIQAIQNDCKDCSQAQKEGAGKVIASMMTYDPAAWKMFMTRTALQIKTVQKAPEPAPEHYRQFISIRSTRSQIQQAVDIAREQAAAGEDLIQVDAVVLGRVRRGLAAALAGQADEQDQSQSLHSGLVSPVDGNSEMTRHNLTNGSKLVFCCSHVKVLFSIKRRRRRQLHHKVVVRGADQYSHISKIIMKSFTIVCLFALAAVAYARPGDTYTDKFDNVNLDEILANRRLLIPYLKCVLEQGKCTADGKELKSHIKEALENNCAKCTDAQRRGTRRVIGHIINHEAEYWNQLCAKYDPERKFVAKYETELKSVAA